MFVTVAVRLLNRYGRWPRRTSAIWLLNRAGAFWAGYYGGPDGPAEIAPFFSFSWSTTCPNSQKTQAIILPSLAPFCNSIFF